MAFPFRWNSKPEAWKRKSRLNTFADGGINIVDIRTKIEYLFVKQILQLIKEHNAMWTFLAVYWLGIHLKNVQSVRLFLLLAFQTNFTKQQTYEVSPVTC